MSYFELAAARAQREGLNGPHYGVINEYVSKKSLQAGEMGYWAFMLAELNELQISVHNIDRYVASYLVNKLQNVLYKPYVKVSEQLEVAMGGSTSDPPLEKASLVQRLVDERAKITSSINTAWVVQASMHIWRGHCQGLEEGPLRFEPSMFKSILTSWSDVRRVVDKADTKSLEYLDLWMKRFRGHYMHDNDNLQFMNTWSMIHETGDEPFNGTVVGTWREVINKFRFEHRALNPTIEHAIDGMKLRIMRYKQQILIEADTHGWGSEYPYLTQKISSHKTTSYQLMDLLLRQRLQQNPYQKEFTALDLQALIMMRSNYLKAVFKTESTAEIRSNPVTSWFNTFLENVHYDRICSGLNPSDTQKGRFFNQSSLDRVKLLQAELKDFIRRRVNRKGKRGSKVVGSLQKIYDDETLVDKAHKSTTLSQEMPGQPPGSISELTTESSIDTITGSNRIIGEAATNIVDYQSKLDPETPNPGTLQKRRILAKMSSGIRGRRKPIPISQASSQGHSPKLPDALVLDENTNYRHESPSASVLQRAHVETVPTKEDSNSSNNSGTDTSERVDVEAELYTRPLIRTDKIQRYTDYELSVERWPEHQIIEGLQDKTRVKDSTTKDYSGCSDNKETGTTFQFRNGEICNGFQELMRGIEALGPAHLGSYTQFASTDIPEIKEPTHSTLECMHEPKEWGLIPTQSEANGRQELNGVSKIFGDLVTNSLDISRTIAIQSSIKAGETITSAHGDQMGLTTDTESSMDGGRQIPGERRPKSIDFDLGLHDRAELNLNEVPDTARLYGDFSGTLKQAGNGRVELAQGTSTTGCSPHYPCQNQIAKAGNPRSKEQKDEEDNVAIQRGYLVGDSIVNVRRGPLSTTYRSTATEGPQQISAVPGEPLIPSESSRVGDICSINSSRSDREISAATTIAPRRGLACIEVSNIKCSDNLLGVSGQDADAANKYQSRQNTLDPLPKEHGGFTPLETARSMVGMNAGLGEQVIEVISIKTQTQNSSSPVEDIVCYNHGPQLVSLGRSLSKKDPLVQVPTAGHSSRLFPCVSVNTGVDSEQVVVQAPSQNLQVYGECGEKTDNQTFSTSSAKLTVTHPAYEECVRSPRRRSFDLGLGNCPKAKSIGTPLPPAPLYGANVEQLAEHGVQRFHVNMDTDDTVAIHVPKCPSSYLQPGNTARSGAQRPRCSPMICPGSSDQLMKFLEAGKESGTRTGVDPKDIGRHSVPALLRSSHQGINEGLPTPRLLTPMLKEGSVLHDRTMNSAIEEGSLVVEAKIDSVVDGLRPPVVANAQNLTPLVDGSGVQIEVNQLERLEEEYVGFWVERSGGIIGTNRFRGDPTQ